MKTIIIGLTVLFSLLNLAKAQEGFLSNQDCIEVYRDGYIMLSNEIENFNEGYSNRAEFAFMVSGISTEMALHRGACLIFENTQVTGSCVAAYKDLYKDLRSKVRVGAVIAGNQTKVTYSKKMQKVVEEETRVVKDESFLGKIGRALRLGTGVISETIQRSRDITMLEFIDMKCNQ